LVLVRAAPVWFLGPTRDSPLQEMIKGEPYGYDADLWAFGVFVFEMLMGMYSITKPHKKYVRCSDCGL
jgi:serine/threonine protein kinase